MKAFNFCILVSVFPALVWDSNLYHDEAFSLKYVFEIKAQTWAISFLTKYINVLI